MAIRTYLIQHYKKKMEIICNVTFVSIIIMLSPQITEQFLTTGMCNFGFTFQKDSVISENSFFKKCTPVCNYNNTVLVKFFTCKLALHRIRFRKKLERILQKNNN